MAVAARRDTSGVSDGKKYTTPSAVRDAGIQAVTAVKGAGESQAGAIERTGDATTRGLSGVSETLLKGLTGVANQIAIGQQATGFWKGLGIAAVTGALDGLIGGLGNVVRGFLGGGAGGGITGGFTIPGGGGGIHEAGHWSGGYITGPGGPTDDRIPAWLSNGEYVIKAASVRRFGLSALDHLKW
jgi:hypothetical protein